MFWWSCSAVNVTGDGEGCCALAVVSRLSERMRRRGFERRTWVSGWQKDGWEL
jgi:hypothetical protein